MRVHIRSLWKTENWKADNRTTCYRRSSEPHALKAHGHVVIGFFKAEILVDSGEISEAPARKGPLGKQRCRPLSGIIILKCIVKK